MDRYKNITCCDNARLFLAIEEKLVVPEGIKRSKVQEFARRMGQDSWRKPSNIYDILNGRRPASMIWTLKAADILGIKPYNLFPRWLLAEITSGVFDELESNDAPVTVIQSIGNGDYTNYSNCPYSRLYYDLHLMKDKSMEPEIAKGTILKIAVENKLFSDSFAEGSCYFVKHLNGDTNMRLVYADTHADGFILQPLNPRFEVVIVGKESIERISEIKL